MSIVKFDNVYKDYVDGSEVIHGLKPTSFEIEKGQLVAIVGPSGSGKSTMLTLMGGLQTPTGGNIYFKGQDLGKLSKKEQIGLRFEEIGFVLQESNLIPFLTVKDQFKFVDKLAGRSDCDERAVELMTKMDVLKRANQYPSALSGGERQRVAIARALYNQPSLILADEPTASLDTEKAMGVIALLAELTHGQDRATVVVTHDERLLKYCDRVFRITDGILSEE